MYTHAAIGCLSLSSNDSTPRATERPSLHEQREILLGPTDKMGLQQPKKCKSEVFQRKDVVHNCLILCVFFVLAGFCSDTNEHFNTL